MTSSEVVRLYQGLQSKGIRVWIDGGWCVDALLGQQTRLHADLDLAVERRDASALRAYLASLGLAEVTRQDSTDWNFVLGDGALQLDVHVFAYDEAGRHVYGIAYPFGSLTGTGTLGGQAVEAHARADRLGLSWWDPVQRAVAERATDEDAVRLLLTRRA